jgi:hypothetical protein
MYSCCITDFNNGPDNLYICTHMGEVIFLVECIQNELLFLYHSCVYHAITTNMRNTKQKSGSLYFLVIKLWFHSHFDTFLFCNLSRWNFIIITSYSFLIVHFQVPLTKVARPKRMELLNGLEYTSICVSPKI